MTAIDPLPNGEHLRLGMPRRAMMQFVKDRLKFPERYHRDEQKLGWRLGTMDLARRLEGVRRRV